MSKLLCYLDMDGVLVELTREAFLHHDLDYPYDNPENYGQWDFEKLIGMPQKVFWGSFDANFWATLKWTDDGKDILEMAENAFGKDNVFLCSCPTAFDRGCADCLAGKAKWLYENMPEYNYKFFFGAKKELLASGSGTVLIDDADHNVDKFIEHGGNAFLLPRPWNSSHENSDDALGYLKDFLLLYE